ncbi:hypothetical protein vBPaerPs25_101 [Pseudomonas phage vB_Paer_Ps25]|uniref:Uncharacterized protein n=1 Tax=Pseudomonas phage vB_Paer_Ps12 TaxID=2924904 RepID=A0AAE9KFP8_9CAUD|nr:hypothetical protein QE347_gp101 [Pseudomonas phage vB_Paer_Ps12]UOL47557.1 hypothetical protein vBPaerPs12_101 [Pseudomonas phage vB_Paer_Ps12]UOL47745.1 hypothetical protein vBPaerPs25_101 [Pseudomonas phage vB_Paer_Ps25]
MTVHFVNILFMAQVLQLQLACQHKFQAPPVFISGARLPACVARMPMIIHKPEKKTSKNIEKNLHKAG